MTTALLLAHLCGPGYAGLAYAAASAAQRWRVPVAVLVAMAYVESTCRPSAVGPRGGVGLLQVVPGTRAAHGHTAEELKNSRLNLALGARHLRYWMDRCGDLEAALGVYAGHHTCRAGRESGYSRRVLQLANADMDP